MTAALHLPAGPQADSVTAHQRAAARFARVGMLVLLLGACPAAAWLALAPLASAVVAQAHVKVDLDRRPVQHAEGGIVREVKVRDGQRVRRGEALIVLGDVGVAADVDRLAYRELAERIGAVRLAAEQAGLERLAIPPDLLAAAGRDARLADQLTKERALFKARREALTGQVQLLRSQREKIQAETASLRAQIGQALTSLSHQQAELERHQKLLADGFIAHARIAQLEAAVADYGIKLEERRSELARAGQRMDDTDLKIKALETDYRHQASDQLKIALVRLSEIQQELRKSSDASARQVIAAPADGEVMNLRYSSPGSVVGPRETVADIVPADPRLVIEAQIRPEDISRVGVGQNAHIRFTAFNALTTPVVEGRVFYVSADRSVHRETQQPYYLVQVEADAGSLRASGIPQLQAGMPAEVFIQGPERTALEYLVEPVTLVMRRAGRER
ncbi:HlyD family type I secretion periplasmic adaptor subunit [Ramlibacter sp. AW1]|uniref:Membrane fusion protein (MFP) family protein n=1 Tax=Ramlibacter aurantiacus TaxID=2801330 RepID=A0A936ZSX8_9BURK|nr:HlyD family type I secretion periplasmic adaptor subunit [Ramlibacter aurantiacus]MBL0423055.1 HlyD family type I secretion periplasmic adaptor subunit [Ramlibacter aurantiacus]